MVALWTRGSFLQAAIASTLTISPGIVVEQVGPPERPLPQRQYLQQGVLTITSTTESLLQSTAELSAETANTGSTQQECWMYAPAAVFVRAETSRLVRKTPELSGSILRLAFHDATVRSVASDADIGGADGSIRYELDWPESRGLAKPLAAVTAIYEAQQVLSFADTLALAGAAAVEASGGPSIPVRLGRMDVHQADKRYLDEPIKGLTTMDQPVNDRATIASSLPSAGLDSVGLRHYFGRLGLTEREFVALSGSHDMGRHVSLLGMSRDCLKNLTRTCLEEAPVLLPFVTKQDDSQYKLSNRYFRALLRWNKREIEYGESAFIPTDVALVVDDGLCKHVTVFASNERLFFGTFRRAYQKLVDSTATSASRY